MKKLLAVATIALFLAFKAVPETFTADTKASAIHWLGKKASGQHDGFVGQLGAADPHAPAPAQLDLAAHVRHLVVNRLAEAMIGEL